MTRGVPAAVGRALAATAAMALGFLAVFGTFGFLTVSLASTVQRYMPYVTMVIGIALVVLGIWLLAGRELSFLMPNRLARSASWAPTRRLGSMFGYGVGYAIASLSCTIGPFLAVTGAGVGGTSLAGRVWIYVAYAAGFALVVGVLAVAAALAGSALVDRMRANPALRQPYWRSRADPGRALCRLLRLLRGPGCSLPVAILADPVIAAAGRLQGAIAGWVHRHGSWPWILVLVVLLLAAALWSWRRRVGATSRPTPSHGDRATAGDEP